MMAADVVAGDEFRHGVRRFLRLRLIVLGDHADLASADAAGGVDLFDGEHDAVVRRLAEGRLGAGERAVFADDDVRRFFVRRAGGGDQCGD